MKVPYVPLEINLCQYEQDGPLNERGIPQYKKGDSYYRANPESCKWVQYSSAFLGQLGLLDLPRKITQEQKNDVEQTKLFILHFWNELEEEFVIKCVNKAKSKKLKMFPFIASELYNLKNQ